MSAHPRQVYKTFYARFEATNIKQPWKTLAGSEDQLLLISEADMRKTLKRLNTHKAAGPDGVPGRVLRVYTDQLAGVFWDRL
jgi:hypothetical protein